MRLSYWIDGVFKGSYNLPSLSYERNLSYISLWAGEGSAWFDDVKVWTGVGGTVIGINPRRVTCKNIITGQEITIWLDGATSWDCEGGGLEVNPDDRIRQSVTGIAD